MRGDIIRQWQGSPVRAILAGFALLVLACAPAIAAPKVIAPAGAALQIEVSKGRLIRLDQPATSVFVAEPDIADVQVKSPSLVYVFGKAAGETTLYAVGDGDQVLLNATVIVRHNIPRLEEAIRELDPRSAVSVSTVDDQLVLEGTVFSAAAGEDIRKLATRFVADPKQLLNKMRVNAPNQINIRVRMAEMSRQTVKQFGFNWQAMFGAGNFILGLATGRGFVDVATGLATRAAGKLTADTLNNAGVGFKQGNTDVNALLDALENHGLINVLAEPNLSAVSGEPASFLAGGEFPIPVPQGNNTISIDFKKFGVSLNFVATIAEGNRINLHVLPEVSQLSTTGAITLDNIVVPALTTRRAETTIELASGQSFAIAGLLQNNITQNLDKFPWLGDVPVLGSLFRSTAFKHDESELVVIVTPYIVRPANTANRLMAPSDGYLPPSDGRQVLNGDVARPQQLKQNPQPATRSGTGLIGPAGFDLD
ncbi:MAG TPA: type II and III secretion system protein family protein [Stellaceae bacterium]|nr:type II and III secretion system protein family protein [Stellaceae bacterium]